MRLRSFIPVPLGLALALALPTARAADDDLTRALATLSAVGKEGKGNEDAAPAWKALVGKGGPALLPTLAAIRDDNATAANWLRAAVDAIAEGETAAGRKLPADKLEAFVLDTKNAATSRRVAYELLVAQVPEAKEQLLPKFLNDKSPDLRRDSVALELEKLEKDGKPTAASLEKLFGFSRDKDQVEALAKKVADAGGKVSVSEHFGFVTHAALVGPFDSTGGKGFAVAYPPEAATNTTGTFTGKGGEELKWRPFDVANKDANFDLNKLIGKHKDAAAYAFAVVAADAETPCDIRVTSITAVQIFLNGQRLYGREEYHHGAPFDGGIGKGTLRKGENVIVLKICQNNQTEQWAQNWFFQMRVCDATGGPLPLKQKVTANGKDALVKLGFIAQPIEEKDEKEKK